MNSIQSHQGLKLLIWNSRSIKNKKDELLYMVNQQKVDIMIISESWLLESESFVLPNFNIIRNDREDGRGGICVCIKVSLNYKILEIYYSPEIHNFQYILFQCADIDLIALYNPPQTNITALIWNRILRKLTNKYSIVTGDFNINALSNEDNNLTNKFIELQNLMIHHNLICVNDSTPTRLGSLNQSNSSPDLTFCTYNLTPYVTWSVFPDTMNSDHFPIICSIKTSGHNVGQIMMRRNIKSINWSLYKAYMTDYTNTLNNENEIKDLYNFVLQGIYNYLDIFHPKHTIIIEDKKVKPIWWNSECSQAVARRRRAIGIFKKQMTPQNYINMKKTIAQTKRIIKTTKKQSWHDYCQSFSDCKTSTLVWQKIRWFTKTKIRKTNVTQKYGKEWCYNFLKLLAPDWCTPEILFSEGHNIENSPLVKSITLQELKLAVPKHSNTKPGTDEINYNLIYNLPETTLELIVLAFNFFLRNNIIPDQWREFKIVPILKPNKPVDDFISFRPIALSNCFRKVFERIITNRLYFYLEKSRLWPSSQFGFRKGHGTINNVVLLSTDILIAFNTNKVLDAAFLDLNSAYDNIRPDILTACLKSYSLPVKLIQIIYSLITERRISVSNNTTEDDTEYRTTSLGLPQGSVLSPILFTLYTGGLQKVVEHHCRITQFADDICIYQRREDVQMAPTELQNGISAAISWLSNIGLSVNINKCCSLTFSRKRNIQPSGLKIYETTIPSKFHTKYLGVYFDSKLTWDFHIKQIIRKIQEVQPIFRYLCGRWWGANHKSLLLIFNALVRSRIEYCSFIMDITYKKYDKQIDSALYAILKRISGLNGNPSRKALEIELNILPHDIRRNILANNFILKNIHYTSNIIIPKIKLLAKIYNPRKINKSNKNPALLEALNNISQYDILRMQNAPCYTLEWEEIISPRMIISSYIDLKQIVQFKYGTAFIQEQCFRRHSSHISIFTDGSKQVDGTGAGLYCPTTNTRMKFKLPSEITIFTAETFAIREALIFIKNRNLKHVIIYSDSKSVIEKLQNISLNCSDSWYITNILHLLYELRNNGITIAWIPSHCGIEGNEEADRLAKEAVNTGIEYNILLPVTDLKHKLISLNKEKWNSEWRDYSQFHAKFYYRIQPNIQNISWFVKKNYSRALVNMFIRLRLNTAQVPTYLYKIRKVDSPNCDCGNVGTNNHMLLGCRLNKNSNDQLYSDLVKLHIPLPTEVASLLYNPCFPVIQAMFRHISRCKMKI